MGSLNRSEIIGNLGVDPEVRFTQDNTPVATLSVATTEKFKNRAGETVEDTEWHRVVLWNRLAEIAQEYLRKGSQVYISGKLKTRAWEDKEGVKKYTTEIIGRELVMLGEPSRGSTGAQGDRTAGESGGASSGSVEGVTADQIKGRLNIEDDDDLPF